MTEELRTTHIEGMPDTAIIVATYHLRQIMQYQVTLFDNRGGEFTVAEPTRNA